MEFPILKSIKTYVVKSCGVRKIVSNDNYDLDDEVEITLPDGSKITKLAKEIFETTEVRRVFADRSIFRCYPVNIGGKNMFLYELSNALGGLSGEFEIISEFDLNKRGIYFSIDKIRESFKDEFDEEITKERLLR